MNSLQSLLNQKEKLQANFSKQLDHVTVLIQAEYDKTFEKDKALQHALSELEQSKDYGVDELGIFTWVRFDLRRYKNCKEYLETYLSDKAVGADFVNDSLLQYHGPQLILSEDGDVLDEYSGKWIINHKEYETKKQLFALVNAWRQKNKCFPSLFRIDQYNNVSLIKE